VRIVIFYFSFSFTLTLSESDKTDDFINCKYTKVVGGKGVKLNTKYFTL